MLPNKVRTEKIIRKIVDPQGVDRWTAPVIAKGIAHTTIKALAGMDEVEIDDLDAMIIRWTCVHLRRGNPCYNPFSGGIGAMMGARTMTVSAAALVRMLS